MDEEKNAYRYVLKRGGVIIKRGWTYNFNRRACGEKARYPDATIEQVGGKTTQSKAEEWERRRSKVRVKLAQVEAIKPKTDYSEIIQVNVPTRFYWNPDKTFDGIEFGPFDKGLLPWEQDMIDECLNAVKPAMGVTKEG